MSKPPTASMDPSKPPASPPSGQAGGQVGLKSGSKLGKYEIIGRLGLGGMALVYKGYDPLLDRFVAIKQVSSHLAADPKFLERFRKEAQILAKLAADQANVVQIYELIEDPRGLFIIMEYVEGQTLDMLLANHKGAMPVQMALQVLWQVAVGLRAIHERGIIHRDIKPANILVGVSHRCRITDFGVAARSGGKTSMTMGTTKYMAPELFGGEEVDGRVDVYSLGCVIYEMLCGPERFAQIFKDIVRDERAESLRWMKWHTNRDMMAPLLHQVNPQVPEILGKIVAKMMAKDPQQRFASAEHVLEILKRHFTQQGQALRAARAVAKQKAAAPPPPVERRPEPIPTRPSAPAASAVPSPQAGPGTTRLPKRKMTRRQRLTVLGVLLGVIVAAMGGFYVTDYLSKARVQSRAAAAYDQARAFWAAGELPKARVWLLALQNHPRASEDAQKLWPAGADDYDRAHAWLTALHKEGKAADLALPAEPGSDEYRHGVALLRTVSTDRKAADEWSKLWPVNVKEEQRPGLMAMAVQKDPNLRAALLRMLPPPNPEDRRLLANLMSVQNDKRIGQTKYALEWAPARLAWLDGRLAIARGEWAAAESAKKRMDEQKVLSREEIRKFHNELRDEKFFAEKVAEALRLMDDGLNKNQPDLFDKAKEALEAAEAVKKTQSLEKEFNLLVARRRELQYREYMAQARALESSRPDEAANIYKKAQGVLNTPEVRQKLLALQDKRDQNDLTAKAKAAVSDNKPADALRYWEEINRRWPSEAASEEIRKIKALDAFARGKKALDAGDEATADQWLRIAEKQDPRLEPNVQKLLATIKNRNEFASLVRSGDTALAAGDFELAKQQYRAALKIQADDKLNDKIRQASFRQKLAQAEDAVRQGKWDEAEQSFKMARNLVGPQEAGQIAMIDKRLTEIQRDRNYQARRNEGDKSFAAGKFDEALVRYKEARKVLIDAKADTKEVDDRIKETNYARFLHSGKVDMERSQWQAALSWLNMAKKEKSTEEVDLLIAEVEARIEEERRKSQAQG